MGFFSRKTTVSVSSSIYNLAGDEANRPDFLRMTILSAAMGQKNIAQTITGSYINGQGVINGRFAKWARTKGYNTVVGQTTGGSISGNSINLPLLNGEIPVTVGNSASTRQAEIGEADFTWWAEQYVAKHHPELFTTDFMCDFNELTNKVTITYEDATTESFTATTFDKDAVYLYAAYYEVTPPKADPIDTGVTVILNPSDPFPDTTDWTLVSDSVIPHSETLVTETTEHTTYSDGRPDDHNVTTTSTTESYNEQHSLYDKYESMPSPPLDLTTKSNHLTMYFDTVGSIEQEVTVNTVTVPIGGGVTKTTTTTVVADVIKIERTYRIDEQVLTYTSYGNIQLFIYKQNSGNAILDAMFEASKSVGDFFPIIPIRINNADVKSSYPDLYPHVKKAFRKATGSRYDKIRESVNDNAQIGEIDFANIVFGVSLNVKENACRKYIYNFFKLINDDPNRQTELDYEDWKAKRDIAYDSMVAWVDWRNTTYSETQQPPPEPEILPYPTFPTNQIKIGSQNIYLQNMVVISWAFIDISSGSGLLKPGAKKGEVWLSNGASEVFNDSHIVYTDDYGYVIAPMFRNRVLDLLYINYQETPTSWKQITIRGLSHSNLVYAGRFVITGSKEALNDSEESPFIIPMHETIFKSMSLKDRTQMATANTFIVFNCYSIYKQKWYETGFFKFIIIVVAIALTVWSMGTDGGGFIAAATKIGTAVGLSGTAAVVVGAIIIPVVAMVVTEVITRIAIKVFGEKWGRIIGAVLSSVAMMVGGGMLMGANFTTAFGQVLTAPNLLQLTMSAGNAYGNVLKGEAEALSREALKLGEELGKETERIQNLYQADFGQGNLDIKQLVEEVLSPVELPDTFFDRTLLVGSDIADMTINMLYNFVEITTDTKLPM